MQSIQELIELSQWVTIQSEFSKFRWPEEEIEAHHWKGSKSNCYFVGSLWGLKTISAPSLRTLGLLRNTGLRVWYFFDFLLAPSRCLRYFVGGPFLWENREKGRPHSLEVDQVGNEEYITE
ncbi:hypothetical protein AVEN_47146-1 [Araneus ventricosus]|uniref:Uncharacterized protein n=1 Tax=Araneus ventricosus TaxID=182803 RepID=A0A4Y2UBX0_ARAVE|nr:hypothetical protein AVEN_47146-1 [Araneus ventricosus]